jgi:hypothetical protein
MELAGLELATSWVRSTRSSERELTSLQDFLRKRLECRNISRNIPAGVCRSWVLRTRLEQLEEVSRAADR